jgi:NAD(P)-dependent dehydrogenase (short-subunit alcohol dehydrogenase family)
VTDRTILVTGATDGLGRRLVAELAGTATVIGHGRNPDRLARLRHELGVETVRADLGELRQVDRMADEVAERFDRLDVLVNNAGVGFGADRRQREESADGIELRFAVNYLAGYHLTRRLLPLLVSSAPARIVNVASAGQHPIDFGDPLLRSSYDGVRAYGQSKLAQIMFTVDLAFELAGKNVTANALHPATYMDTAMVRDSGIRPISSVADGTAATLRLISDPALDEVSGRYFSGRDLARPDPQAYDEQARRRLRELSDELIAAATGGGIPPDRRDLRSGG